MKFTREIIVRFAHCDAAGLMFYPRFFTLVNEMVEDWFAAMDHSFSTLHLSQRKGVPTVRFEAEFTRAARMGDRLTQTLTVEHIGESSCQLLHEAHVDGAPVARFTHTIVYVDLDLMKSEPWPEPLRASMSAYQERA